MHHLATKAASAAIPQLVNAGVKWFLNLFSEAEPEIPKPVKKSPKPYDRTKITRHQFDLIIELHSVFILENMHRAIGVRAQNTTELCVSLNEILGLNKSKTFYSNIWNGHVDRDSLSEY